MKRKVMGITFTTWITVLAALLSFLWTTNAATTTKQATLDQGTVKMLSSILESLDAFRNDRLRDLERIRLATPSGNVSSEAPSDAELYLTPKNSSISEHIKALKDGIMGHNPVKKTFGYKVTVYTSPIGEDGKDSKPVLVTQYVGGDMIPEKKEDIKRKGEVEDLEESAAHQPELQMVQSSESVHIPIHSLSDAAGVEEDAQSAAKAAASDHNRKTEHSASSDKGHSNAHSLKSKLEKGHDHEKHSAKHDEHHKETEKESHRHDEQAHDKGGASQQGIKERTEIEYYEREHFLDTEYDKAKTGHEKTNGLKEHESHNDHDTHEHKKEHAKEDSTGHKLIKGASVDKSLGTAVKEEADIVKAGVHYTPPYGMHYHQRPHLAHVDQTDYKENHKDHDEGHKDSKHSLSEETKGHKEHNHEKDHQSEQKDTGYVDKDKGRRKEGYRERGYKITAEREYFLNDAHHDKGHATHTSGSRLKDQEGAAHGSKEGERDRGFVKEEKQEEAHDAAYDAKERKYYDGEQHKEEVQEEKAKTTSIGQNQKQEEVLPVAPAGVNYLDPHHHIPLYAPHHPISYAPSNDGAQALLALPPDDLKKNNKANPQQQLIDHRRNPDRNNQKQQPIGGYDDDYEDPQTTGYVGHAGYKKRPHSSLIASIKENVKKDVHRKPPTYSKPPKETSEEDNSVRFPDEKENSEKYNEEDSEEDSEEVIFPQDDEKSYRSEVKYHRDHDDDHVYPVSKNAREQDLINLHEEHQRNIEKEKPHRNVPNRNVYQQGGHHNPYPQHENNRESQRYHERPPVYAPGIQNPDKLLRTIDQNAYPQIQSGKLPTVSEILEEVSRFPQRKPNKPYLEAHQKTQENRNQQGYQPELQQFYHHGPETFAAQRQRDNQREHLSQREHMRNVPNQGPPRHQQQQGHIGNLTPLLHLANQQQSAPRGLNPLEQLQQQKRQLEQIQQQHFHNQQQQNQRNNHQQQHSRGVTPLEQLQQQQTKPPFSPVVLLSRGPPVQPQNQAVDVWYTRQ